MTKREFFNAIINSSENEEIVEFATNELARMDSSKSKVSSKKLEERARLGEAVLAIMENNRAYTCSEIATAMGWFNEKNGKANTTKASNVMKFLCENGKTISAFAEGEKGRAQKVYTKN